jgi:hypothetical protein
MTNIGPAAYHLHQQQGHLGHGYGSPAAGSSFPPSVPPQQYSQPQYSAQRQPAPVQHNYQQFQQQNLAYGNFQPQSNASIGSLTSSGKCQTRRSPQHAGACNRSRELGCISPVCYTCQNRALTNLAIKLLNQYIPRRHIVSLLLLRVHQCQRPNPGRHPTQGPDPSSLTSWPRLANPSSQIL